MDESLSHEKIQRAVDGGRGGAAFGARQGFQKGIGAHRLMTAPYKLQHMTAGLGEARAALPTQLFRTGKRRFHANAMVMVDMWECVVYRGVITHML